MPSNLTDDEREAAVAILYRMIDDAINSAIPEPWDVADRLAGRALDALLAAGWSPRRTGAAETGAGDARAAAEVMREAARDVAENMAALVRPYARRIFIGKAPNQRLFGEQVTALDIAAGIAALPLPAAPTPDAISAAEARGRRGGIEAAAKVAREKHAKFRAFALLILDAPPDQYQVGGATASREIAEAIDALSPAPKEPDHG